MMVTDFNKNIMKTNQNIKYLFLILSGFLFLAACKKEEVLPEAPRLFRPAIKGELEAPGNYIEASWQKVKSATSYTVQLSKDTFKTIDITLNVDSTGVIVEDLLWEQLYQVQIRANAPDSLRNSKFALLGEIKTPRFPTILNRPSINDVSYTEAKVSWENSGAPVTSIKVLLASDNSLVKEVSITAADIAAGFKVIDGLDPATIYNIQLFSRTTLRGFDTYTTKTPYLGDVIDLTGISDRPSVLADTIPVVPAGSTILLKRGMTYNISSAISLSKTLVITSGADVNVPENATIFMSNNFNFAAGSNIDSLIFRDVILRGSDYAQKYVFNTTNDATVGKISFENCIAEIFRGVIRLQRGVTTVSNISFNNCIIDSIANYGVLTVDNVTCKAENISITNSTINNVQKLIDSRKQGSNSVLIENCTFNRIPWGGNYLVDYDSQPVTAGIKVLNNIFGVGKDKSGSVTVKGIRANGSSIDASNNFATSDHVVSSDPIPNITQYTRPSTELFENPQMLNFKIIDATFPGRNSAGDPRWR